MSKAMRAKMVLQSVEPIGSNEKLVFSAVAKSEPYDAEGSDEDNTYAKFSPSARLEIQVANPALIGQFQVGEKYYLDFTPTDA